MHSKCHSCMKMAVLTKTLGIVQRVTFTDYRLTKILCAVYIKQENLENPRTLYMCFL